MSELAEYLAGALGHRPEEMELYERALTHGSHARDNYQRLEFIGDRVLGLIIARWLYERFPDEPEGTMSRRYNALVARETCALVGREIRVMDHVLLGKQAREDRASNSDNVVGDVVEALIGALYLEGGLDNCESFIRMRWAELLDGQKRPPMHPKSALQELAAERGWGIPDYEVTARTGAHHAPTFTVRVTVRGGGEAEAEGSSKQDAETAAAEALLAKIQ